MLLLANNFIHMLNATSRYIMITTNVYKNIVIYIPTQKKLFKYFLISTKILCYDYLNNSAHIV